MIVTLKVAPNFLRSLQTSPPKIIVDQTQDSSELYTLMTPAEPNLSTAMVTKRSHSYLSYRPTTSIKTHSNDHFFDLLGFKPARATRRMRTAFMDAMTSHVQPVSHRFLNRAANPEAFKVVVSEFLAEYGPTYWGDSNRSHLEEPDTLKGFLCPRDALRAQSRQVYAELSLIMTNAQLLIRFVAVVEGFFNFKAYVSRRRDVSYSRPDCPREY